MSLPFFPSGKANSRSISTSGSIGFHIAQQLAIKGAKVYITTRDAAKATNAIKELKETATSKEGKELNLASLVVDFGEFGQILDAVKQFLATETRLDILVNNAATYALFSLLQS